MYQYINHQTRRRSKKVSRLSTHSRVLSSLMNPLAARTTKTAIDDDEEAQLKALQAELAM